MSLIINISESAEKSTTPPPEHIDIHLFCQFFINTDESRQAEIVSCLVKNAANPYITHIHLLNERIYTVAEMGVNSPKIIQYDNCGERMTFKHIIDYVHDIGILGYFILANSDIIFDDTLINLPLSTIHECDFTRARGLEWKGERNGRGVPRKEMFSLLRYEYDTVDMQKSALFGPRFDSQDTWIFHSNNFIDSSQSKIFDIEFGRPGCDNKLIYLMNILGFTIINDPQFIKTYHLHTIIARNHIKKDTLPPPYGIVVFNNCPVEGIALLPPGSIHPGLKIFHDSICPSGFNKIGFKDNAVLRDYITSKIVKGENFIILKLPGVESHIINLGRIRNNDGLPMNALINYIHKIKTEVQRAKGIKISNIDSLMKYAASCLSAYDDCEMFGIRESWGEVNDMLDTNHKYLLDTYARDRITIWKHAFDVFNYIHDSPWTCALRGKRILIISSFAESIREKIPTRESIYGIDLFPECEITTILPPQTHMDSPVREFDIELSDFLTRLNDIRDTYDYALVSCGGYSTLVCHYIFKSGKSSIYVGGSLQMMFGVLGKRWIQSNQDIVKLYRNDAWSFPKESERPIGLHYDTSVYV